MIIKRGNIYLAALDPTIGSEINKTRPVIVVSNNINNDFGNIVTIIPLTSNTEKSTLLKFSLNKMWRTFRRTQKQRQIK